MDKFLERLSRYSQVKLLRNNISNMADWPSSQAIFKSYDTSLTLMATYAKTWLRVAGV